MHLKLRSLLATTTLAAVLLAGASITSAQDAAPERPRRDMAGNPEQRINRLKEALQLTEEQVASLKEIMAAEAEAARAAREKLGTDATREQRMESRRAVAAEFTPKIEAVLTEEQRVKWTELRERMQRGGPGGQGGQRPQGGPAAAQP